MIFCRLVLGSWRVYGDCSKPEQELDGSDKDFNFFQFEDDVRNAVVLQSPEHQQGGSCSRRYQQSCSVRNLGSARKGLA